MQITINPAGHLVLSCESGDSEEITNFVDQAHRSAASDIDSAVLYSILDYFRFHEKYHVVNPKDVGGLTGAPILTDSWTCSDDGTTSVEGRLWWYPQYEGSAFFDVLIKEGTVTFSATAAK